MGWIVRQARVQREAVAATNEAGGSAHYDSDPNAGPSRNKLWGWKGANRGDQARRGAPHEPDCWPSRVFGVGSGFAEPPRSLVTRPRASIQPSRTKCAKSSRGGNFEASNAFLEAWTNSLVLMISLMSSSLAEIGDPLPFAEPTPPRFLRRANAPVRCCPPTVGLLRAELCRVRLITVRDPAQTRQLSTFWRSAAT